MSDWQVGDLAVCVDDELCRCGCSRPVSVKAGRTYRVEQINRASNMTYLRLVGVTPINGHERGTNCERFRKIRPDELTECEEEFRILLKLSKQRVSA